VGRLLIFKAKGMINKMNEIMDLEEFNIVNIINNLKNINSTNSKIYHHGILINYKFNFCESATSELLIEFETKINAKLPDDYRQFLEICNGMTLESEAEFLDIDQVLEYYTVFDYPKDIIVIATCLGGHFHIAINLKEDNNKYMYVIEPIGGEFFNSINCSFTEFINKFIVSYGSDYWNWGVDFTKTIPKIDFDNLSD
jgi:hypothetical protein